MRMHIELTLNARVSPDSGVFSRNNAVFFRKIEPCITYVA